jgi:hypothetical protein
VRSREITRTRARVTGKDITRIIWSALPLLGVLFLLPRLYLWAQTGTTFIAWPWQFDLAEGVNLNATVLLAQGHNIYIPNVPESFVSAPYTPLFYLLNVPFTWITGPSFGVGRTISMLSTLAVAVLLFYVVRRVTSVWSAGVLAGALWLSISPVITWSALYTQHTLALALGFGGLAWTLRYSALGSPPEEGAPSGLLYVGAILFALAFYTKQSAIDAAAATVLWLIASDARKGWRFAGLLAGLIVIPFAAVNFAVQGGLWEKVIANHPVSWSNSRAWRLLGRVWSEYWPLMVWALLGFGGIIVGFVIQVRIHRSRSALRQAFASPWTLTALYALAATASVLARIGNDGINYNHFLDMLIPCCLLAGLSVGWIVNRLQANPIATVSDPLQVARTSGGAWLSRVALGAVALSAVLMVAQLLQFDDPHTWYTGMWPEQSRDGQMRALSKLAAETPGDILSDDSYLLLSTGHRVVYDDSFMFATLANMGKWDNSTLVRSLRDRRFGLLFLFDTDRWPENQQKALEDNYTLKFRDVLRTFVPLIVPASTQYNEQCVLANNQDKVSLTGYSLAPGVADSGIKRGDVLRAALYWHPDSKLKQDYASYVHLLSENGEKVAAQDNPHTGAIAPTTAWVAGSTITDTVSIPIPATVPPGRYRLVGGMYQFDQASGKIEALPASCTQGEPYGDAVSLGWIDVR